jgi:hypothetical protein
MAAIISDKFRIFNAQQFLESLTEGSTDSGSERTRMYFFVGRPQRWDSFLEIYNKNSTAFVAGQFVYVGTNWATATFKATIREVKENSLILHSVGPTATSTPSAGSVIKGYNGSADTGATAVTGVYRYATEDIPPVPLDTQTEKYEIYDDIIAAKRITSTYARAVIRRYNWDILNNPKFDMWKPDYSATPVGGGQVGKSSATGANSISNAKFYIMNQRYEVFKCLYNGESPTNPSGVNVTYEPKTTPSAGQGTYANGLYKEPGNTYIWKYMYTIPTDDVLRFLSTDFMPIALSGDTNSNRPAVEAAAVDGSIDVALIKTAGANLPNGTHYAPIIGDGTGGVVELVISAGAISSVNVVANGSGYTYASIPLVTGVTTSAGKRGLFTAQALSTPVTVAANATGALEVILPPLGGHGSDMEMEFNAKRIMTNIRLTFIENAGDFPVDNDFRRIGILRDPKLFGTTTNATADTLSGLKSVKITGATANYIVDETISQTVSTGTAIGQVVSWTLDAGSPTPTPGTPGTGVLKYIQSPVYHTDQGIVKSFESNAANAITGSSSLASGNVDVNLSDGTEILGSIFVDGLAQSEIKPNSGEIIYIENRRLITRASDQIEDIKLVIEF